MPVGMKHLVGAESAKTKRGAETVTHTSKRVAVPVPQCQGRLSQEHRLLPLSPGNETAACPATTLPTAPPPLTPVPTRVSVETL